MFPHGEIWQALRVRALTTIPFGTLLRSSEPSTLGEWLTTGSYTAARTSRDVVTMQASEQELGAALLGDASLFFDAAVEHSFSLRQSFAPNSWSSEGWAVVTTYYWAFYLVTALSRLLGETQLYLDDSRMKSLVMLSGGQGLAAGTYSLKVSPTLEAGRVEVVLKKSNASRVHDAIWRAWTDMMRQLLVDGRARGLERDEADVYETLLRPFNVLGPTWPSNLRNAANYSPGFGYRAVRRVSTAFDVGSLRLDPITSFDDCLSRLRQNGGAITRHDVRDQSRLTTRILIDTTFLLHAVFTELYTEVLERRAIDRRWGNLRNSFLSQQRATFAIADWPLSAGE